MQVGKNYKITEIYQKNLSFDFCCEPKYAFCGNLLKKLNRVCTDCVNQSHSIWCDTEHTLQCI